MNPGRSRSRRKRLPHEVPFWIREGAIFFVTICAQPRGVNQLCQPARWATLLESVRFRHARGIWHCLVFLAMPDHVHALVSLPDPSDWEKIVRSWKAFAAKRCGVRWQAGFFDHRLRGGEQWELKARYIEENPVRKGFVSRPADWIYLWKPEG